MCFNKKLHPFSGQISPFSPRFLGKLVNIPLEQLPLLFKAVLHSCKSSLNNYRTSSSPCVTKGTAPAN